MEEDTQLETQDLATEDQQDEVVNQQEDQQAAPTPTARQVPLEALEAERRKRQELEYQVMMMQQQTQQKLKEQEEDDDDFVSKAELKRRIAEATNSSKREVLEQAFCDANPAALDQINSHLEDIIKRKPWLAKVIDESPNRFARAYEIVQDYMPQPQSKAPAQRFSDPRADAQRAIQNSQKPRNPSTISKGQNLNGADYLKSIAGTSEFRDYRKKMLSGK